MFLPAICHTSSDNIIDSSRGAAINVSITIVRATINDSITMPRCLSREEFDALLARPLHSLTIDELAIDDLTVDFIKELLDKYNVPYDDTLTKIPLHEVLMIHHTNVIAARQTDEDEQATPVDPDAINLTSTVHDIEQCLQERLAAFTASFQMDFTNLCNEMLCHITTVDGNCMTRNNNVRAVACDVFHEEVQQLHIPTNQTVLDTVATATAPINNNIALLDHKPYVNTMTLLQNLYALWINAFHNLNHGLVSVTP
jgi:hypothetical protein